MNDSPPGEPLPPIGPRPTMPPAPHVPDDRTGASALPPPSGPPQPAPPTGQPPQSPVQPPSRSGSHRWWWVVGAGALLLFGGGGGLMGWNHGPLNSSADQQQTYQATALELTGTSGDVRVVGGAAPGTMEVTRHLHWGMMHGAPATKEQVNGQTLSIDSACGGGFMSMCSIDYDVKVPDGAAVTLGLGSGNINVSGAIGALKAETGSGNVDAAGVHSTNAVLRTGSGNIDLSFATAPMNVELRTGSGNVTMWVPKGDSYAVDVTTGSGGQNVEVGTSHSSPRKVLVQTGSGDVRLGYR